MKIKTNRSITSEEWKQQAERFSKITDTVNSLTFPKTGVTNLHAEISLDIEQPLSKGFKGRVKYIQHFQKPIGETTTDAQHVVVDYYERIPRDMVNVMISQFTDNIPSELTDYLDIQDWIIEQGVLQQIVTKNTFVGLTVEDYTIE